MAANQFSYLNMKKGKNLKRSGRKDQLLASSSLGNGQAAASTADSLVSAPGTSHSLQNAAQTPQMKRFSCPLA
ncbi:hypothetical protein EB796_010415 [Bugula neritina]|uniref:Uncharacterized protein n=1 Tax=Bugula neritina TaxID=10212 RepID=A0A7J7K105_BUGNE|nr:hypothetical protein EB796_010415 [Bugula neritina]